MDLIVATCRALASRPRLQLLRVVHECPGLDVQTLAERVQLPLPATSKNLKLLSGFHLIETRPQGRHLQCSPPEPGSTTNVYLRELQQLLKSVLGAGASNGTLAQLSHLTGAAGLEWEDVFRVLVAQFTTFTHLRRLLILRRLVSHGASDLEAVATAIGMSETAARRHLDKLRRRGVVTLVAGSPTTWVLESKAGSPSHRKLLEIVLRALKAD